MTTRAQPFTGDRGIAPPDHEQALRDLLAGFDNWFADEEALAHGRMTQDLHPYTALFSPIRVNSVTLKNRLVMGPMGNIGMADELGRPSQRMLAYYIERARGGVGLITSGLVPVSQGIDPSTTEVGDRSLFPRLDSSRTVFPPWRELAQAIHAHGAHFFVQLTPGLGRVGSPECLVKKLRLPVSASWNPSFYMPQVPCRPLTDGECRRIIGRAGQAAADAQALTIDGVYLHGHEGYLLEQMTNTAFNRRKLGRYADWQAFGVELAAEVRRRTGPRYPLMYRIDLSLALNATYGGRMAQVASLRKFRNERAIAETLDYMAALVAAGVDMFDVDLGCYDNWWLPHPPGALPPGLYLGLAKIVKDDFLARGLRSNAGLPVPVVAVGKLGYPDLAERALREGLCDLVMLARPLLADPQWPTKAYAGRVTEIIPCIGDQEACLAELVEGGHMQCAVNPHTGLEDVLPADPPPADRLKRVAVVGAGPAGILCACTAAGRGHAVTLFERNQRPGGMLVPGSAPRFKFDVANYLAYLEGLLARCVRDYGLALRLGCEVTVETLVAGGFDAVGYDAAGYDAIVICAGARPGVPHVPGVELPHVVQAIDLLRDPSLVGATLAVAPAAVKAAPTAREIVVVGGGDVGCETAYFLAAELGRRVTVIEMLPALMRGTCTANRGHLIHALERAGVTLLTCTRLVRVEPDAVTVVRNVSPTAPDPAITWAPLLPENVINPLARPLKVEERELTLPAGLVVLATGMIPDAGLYRACLAANVAAEVHVIGDAFAPGRVFEAVKAGYAVGVAL